MKKANFIAGIGLASSLVASNIGIAQDMRTFSLAFDQYQDNQNGFYLEVGHEEDKGPIDLLYFFGVNDRGVADIGLGTGINLGPLRPTMNGFYSVSGPFTPMYSGSFGYSMGLDLNLLEKVSLFGDYSKRNHDQEIDNQTLEGKNSAAATNEVLRLGLKIKTSL